ncbi:hypothetical protein D9758_012771 [Tetrapyrgos nigripes]|uniref:Endo-chitosanase n=1 Tax=Tetrapyrgos nigripes TaxID=182062 RepID=A0A8H5FRU3_9AGAR|nr:hypothetical protein D9758_012771 [Tetrapyrgos nigripes]
MHFDFASVPLPKEGLSFFDVVMLLTSILSLSLGFTFTFIGTSPIPAILAAPTPARLGTGLVFLHRSTKTHDVPWARNLDSRDSYDSDDKNALPRIDPNEDDTDPQGAGDLEDNPESGSKKGHRDQQNDTPEDPDSDHGSGSTGTDTDTNTNDDASANLDSGSNDPPVQESSTSQVSFQAASDINVKGIYAAVKAANKHPVFSYSSGQKNKPKVSIYDDFLKKSSKAMSFIADMDVDCDGSSSSEDQKKTTYGALNSHKVPYYVIPDSFVGPERMDSGFIKPNSLGAIICDGKMFYAIMGDTNGDGDSDDEQLIGEASIFLAQACFPKDGLNANRGHDALDVAYIIFGDAVPPGISEDKDTIDIAALKKMGDSTVRLFQKSLGLGGSGTGTGVTKATSANEEGDYDVGTSGSGTTGSGAGMDSEFALNPGTNS